MIDLIANSGMPFLQKMKWFREFGLNTNTIKRFVLIECKKNLSILEPLHLTDPKTAQDSAILIGIAKRIRCDAIETLLASDDLAGKTLAQLEGLDLGPDDESEETTGLKGGNTVARRLLRLYVRMYSVRTLAEVRGELGSGFGADMREIQFRTRLANVRTGLLEIERALSKSMN